MARHAHSARDGEIYFGSQHNVSRQDAEAALRKQHVEFLRDIFGNPFRPVKIDAAWQTPTVIQLAEAIYEDRSYGRLPELADAFQEAGCSDADILGHCRGPEPHVRGCWV